MEELKSVMGIIVMEDIIMSTNTVEVTSKNWYDNAGQVSNFYGRKHIIGKYREVKNIYYSNYNFQKSDLEAIEQYNSDLISSTGLTDIYNVFNKYASNDSLPISVIDSIVTDFINFICKHLYRVNLSIDSFIEDGLELDSYLSNSFTINACDLVKYIQDIAVIENIEPYENEQDVNAKPVTILVAKLRNTFTGLYINKMFNTKYPSFNKIVLNNLIKFSSSLIFKDKNPDIYRDIVNAVSYMHKDVITGKPTICRLYLNIDTFTSNEYLCLIKPDALQLFHM